MEPLGVGLVEPGTESSGRDAGSGCHAKAMFLRPSARLLSLLCCSRFHDSSGRNPMSPVAASGSPHPLAQRCLRHETSARERVALFCIVPPRQGVML